MTSGTDDGGPDGLFPQAERTPAEGAVPDGLPQDRTQISKGPPGVFLGDAVCHTAGK